MSTKSKPFSQVVLFALISLVSFFVGAALLFFMVWKAEKLAALGLTGKLYYIVLLPLGLSVAGFLFGVLQSYASYRGQQFGGSLTLGGPIVAFFLTVILGFVLVPDLSTFPLTVYVHGPGGQHDVVLKNTGEVWTDLGGDRKRVAIGDAGQAYFPAIPSNFRGQEVPISVSSDKFESIQSKIKLAAGGIYLPVRRKAGRFFGHIASEKTDCLAGAKVLVAGLSAPIDPVSGNFDITVPGDRMADKLDLQAVSSICASERHDVYAGSNEIGITMSPAKLEKE